MLSESGKVLVEKPSRSVRARREHDSTYENWSGWLGDSMQSSQTLLIRTESTVPSAGQLMSKKGQSISESLSFAGLRLFSIVSRINKFSFQIAKCDL